MKYGILKGKIKKLKNGLIPIFLSLFLVSCGTKTVTKTEKVYITPPPVYTQTYQIPEIGGVKNRDLLNWALDLKEISEKHNKDKKALQEWAKEVQK